MAHAFRHTFATVAASGSSTSSTRRVSCGLAYLGLEGRIAPDGAQGTLRLPETQFGGDGLTSGDRLVRDGRVLVQ